MAHDFAKRITIGLKSSYSSPDKRIRMLEYACICVFSIIYLTLFSLWTSPLYKDWYGCDASFFTMAGRAITEGRVPYRDIYDLKGPYFFFLQALGQFLCKERLGAFILQIPFLCASGILIWKLALLFVRKSRALFILLTFYTCHIATMWGGNTLEEFALPLSLLCLYVIVKDMFLYAFRPESIPTGHSVLLGLVLGIMILSKITVSGCVLGIIAAIAFLQLYEHHFKSLVNFIFDICMGVAFAFLPVLIYFGINNCLSDMLRCVFVTGFSRSIDYAEGFNITWELKSSACIFAFLLAVFLRGRIRRELAVLLMAISVATYLALHLGTPFYFYFTGAYPCLILAMAVFLKFYDPLVLFSEARQSICILVFAIFLIYYVPISAETINTAFTGYDATCYSEYRRDVEDMVAIIPESERDEIFSFMVDMTWFEAAQLTPCYKYPINLPFFIELDANILPDLERFMNETPPRWIVTNEFINDNLPEMAEIVAEKYECVCENSAGKLYLHR